MVVQGSPRATLESVTAFGKTDLSGDVPSITVAPLIVHRTSDRVVPIGSTAQRLAKMLPDATVREYDGALYGSTATYAAQLTQDLLEFLRQA